MAGWGKSAGTAVTRPFGFLTTILTRHSGLRRRLARETGNLANTAVTMVRDTEPEFLCLAESLKALYGSAAELGRSTATRASSLRDVLSDSRFAGADGTAAILSRQLHAGLEETGAELNSLAALRPGLRRLLHLGRQMRFIASFIRAAGYSFHVESARTEETRQAFGAFSVELEALAERIASIGEEIEAKAEAAHEEIASLVESLIAGLNQLREIAGRTDRLVRETCDETQQLLDLSLGALEQSEARARETSQHAGDAIYHVQFGDIVRQKLEHVARSLQEAASVFRGAGKPAGLSRSAAKADQILAVQQAQIELMVREMDSVRGGLSNAFAGFRAEGIRLAEAVDDLRGGKTPSVGDPFEDLKSRLRHLEELTSRGASLCRQSRESWRRAVNASSEVSRCMEQVREINFRMHLQSLNAIIKTEWLGDDGRTLSVLSGHMHTMFRESNDLVEEIAGVLDTIVRQTETAGKPLREANESGTNLAGGLEKIARAQENVNRIREQAAGLSREQEMQLERAQHQLGFLARTMDRLSGLSGKIGSLRDRIARVATPSQTADDIESAHTLYTMASEREVHRHVLERQTAEASDRHELSPVAAGSGADDLGDNIELF